MNYSFKKVVAEHKGFATTFFKVIFLYRVHREGRCQPG